MPWAKVSPGFGQRLNSGAASAGYGKPLLHPIPAKHMARMIMMAVLMADMVAILDRVENVRGRDARKQTMALMTMNQVVQSAWLVTVLFKLTLSSWAVLVRQLA